MRAINRKLLRDLWNIKGQAVAIGLVITAGVAMFIMYLSTFESLRLTQQSYYDRFRFGDVFAACKRAPGRIEERLASFPGVARVDTRVVVDVNLDVAGLSEPATGRLISIPDRRTAVLNDVFLRRGRWIEPNRPDEVLASEGFTLAHGFGPGDQVTAVINGRRRQLRIVGIVLSPEFIYSIRPGELMPDDSRFGVFWMERKALATAFDMDGGFNDVSVRLMRGASVDDVIEHIDRELTPFGGLGAIPRSLQISHWYLDSELEQLSRFGLIVPIVFLSVAAFLLNVVLTRIVAVQREQIAALKALGYSTREIGLHYAGWSLIIASAGCALGAFLGAWMGRGMLTLYNDFFRFPVLEQRLSPAVVVGAVAVSLAAALLGAFGAVRRAMLLPPAEAMRPEAPARYRVSVIERLGLKRFLAQSARMVIRNVERRPMRTGMSILGIAFAVAILVVGTFFLDSIDELMDVQFNVLQRQDVTVTFTEPASARALHEIESLPGVLRAEPMRSVPARLRVGHRQRRIAITGVVPGADLNRVVDAELGAIRVPPEGLVLSRVLAEILGAGIGDSVQIEVLEGARPVREAHVAGVLEDYMGTSAYMDAEALHRLMREGHNRSGAYLMVDNGRLEELYERLKLTPSVAGVAVKQAAIESFEENLARNMNVMIFFNVIFSVIIAVGVVYNAARISLSERSRELASLRVLGLTRGEISGILLGELAVVTLAAIPAGLALGYGLAQLIVYAFESELYRFPLAISQRTYGFATVVVLVASALSGLLVRRRLDRLDLVAVLKTKE